MNCSCVLAFDWTSTQTLIWLGFVLMAYLCGAIPFGLLIGLAKGVDVRQHGSKNIGTANVGRTLGRKFGVLTFFLDALKGFIPTLGAGLFLQTVARPEVPPALAWMWLTVGLSAIAGHMFSPFLGFKGGKGVATGFGSLLAIFPILSLPAVAALVLWAVSVKVTKFIGFSSCLAAVSIPLWLFVVIPVSRSMGFFVRPEHSDVTWPMWPYATVGVLLAVMVVWKHRSNIGRMIAGTEPRVGQTKPVTSPAK